MSAEGLHLPCRVKQHSARKEDPATLVGEAGAGGGAGLASLLSVVPAAIFCNGLEADVWRSYAMCQVRT